MMALRGFHPNMYRSGKICLSILNTWKGDQWTGCQSIRTILLTIVSIMDNMPLLHEPGFTAIHPDVTKYNKIIYFKNFDFSVNNILLKDSGWNIAPFNDIFEKEMGNTIYKKQSGHFNHFRRKESVQTTNRGIINTGIYSVYLYP